MAKIYDISAKITNELPMIRITDELTVTVNNRKNTVLNVQAMVSEAERNESDEMETMDKALSMLIGEKNAKTIEEMNLPINEYTEIFKSVMNVAQGRNPDESDTP